MKVVNRQIFGLLIFSTLLGCAHSHTVDGPQPAQEMPAGIRVHIGSKEVKEGDRVAVMKSECHQTMGVKQAEKRECHDKKIGEATVLKVLDHDSAIVRPEGGLVMDDTMKVEKIK